MNKKCIKVAIVGAPNVGKSSFLNHVLGRKNSIVSPKPHTTRSSVLGVKNLDQTQIVFTDTPGYIRKGSSVWAECFNTILSDSLSDSDLAVFIIDASTPKSKSTQALLNHLPRDKVIVALNKTDVVARGKLYQIIADIAEMGYEDKVFVISAKSGNGIQDLLDEFVNRAPETDWLFETAEEAELPKPVFAAECVREKAFHCVHEEVPFSLWTRTTKSYFRKTKDNISIQEIFTRSSWKAYVEIIVAQDSHKGIVVGHGGDMIKRIGMAARTELESVWGPGQLFLNVVVDKNWQKNSQKIEEVCFLNSSQCYI